MNSFVAKVGRCKARKFRQLCEQMLERGMLVGFEEERRWFSSTFHADATSEHIAGVYEQVAAFFLG